MTTWAKLGEEMLGNEYFGKYLTSAQSISDELLLSIPDISTKSDLEKVKAIDSYMKKNFSWNGRDDKFTDSNAKLFLSKKTGNAAEINLFETALLTKAGIKAYPVILSTRDHGKISKNYPFHHFFNYVITSAKINGTTILLDATNLLNPYDVLPSKCLNDSGLVIQKNQVRWEKIANTSISKTVYDFTIHPNTKQNHVDQECLLSATGYDAIDFRNQFIYSYKDLKEKMLDGNTYTTDTLSQENLNNIDKPFILKFKKEYPMEYVDNKIIIAPFSNIPITDNPLQQDSRTFPIDMTYPHINQFHSIVEVPEGYKLLSKPENMNLDNDNFKICYISTLENGKVSIDGLYEFKHAIYDSSAYSELKTAFKEIINKFNDKILLVKNL